MEGGLTGVFRNQRKIGFCFIQFLHRKVAWLAQSSILSLLTAMNIQGLRPWGLRPNNVRLHRNLYFNITALKRTECPHLKNTHTYKTPSYTQVMEEAAPVATGNATASMQLPGEVYR